MQKEKAELAVPASLYGMLVDNFDYAQARYSDLERVLAQLQILNLGLMFDPQQAVAGLAKLKQDGWKIVAKDQVKLERIFDGVIETFNLTSQMGFTFSSDKEIIINKTKNAYKRDKVVCHELTHVLLKAIHFEEFDIGYIVPEILIEYIARRFRANPVFLREAILTFNLPPQIYDRASLEAFLDVSGYDQLHWRGKQPAPLAEAAFDKLRQKLLMD